MLSDLKREVVEFEKRLDEAAMGLTGASQHGALERQVAGPVGFLTQRRDGGAGHG